MCDSVGVDLGIGLSPVRRWTVTWANAQLNPWEELQWKFEIYIKI